MADNLSFFILTNESIFKNSEEIRIDMTFDGSKRQHKKINFFTRVLLIDYQIPPSVYLASVLSTILVIKHSLHSPTH